MLLCKCMVGGQHKFDISQSVLLLVSSSGRSRRRRSLTRPAPPSLNTVKGVAMCVWLVIEFCVLAKAGRKRKRGEHFLLPLFKSVVKEMQDSLFICLFVLESIPCLAMILVWQPYEWLVSLHTLV